MKIYLALVGTVSVMLLVGIFWIENDARNQRISDRKEADALARIQAHLQEISDRDAQLHRIVDDFDRQYKFTHEWVDNGIVNSNDASAIWMCFTNSYGQALTMLKGTQLDLTIPMPSTKYLDDEFRLDILIRK